MAAIPIHAPSRYGGRDFDNEPLAPSISTHNEGYGRRPFSDTRRIPMNDNLSPSAASIPMKIRGAEEIRVPPPLPPPLLPPINGPTDPKLQWRFSRKREEYSSPLSDSFDMEFKRRDFPFKGELPDEGYQSMDSSFRSSEFSPFGRPPMSYGNSIDQSMLKKLGRYPRPSGLSSSAKDGPRRIAEHPQPSSTSLPHRSKPLQILDTGSDFVPSPGPMSAISPRPGPFSHDVRSTFGVDYRDFERSPRSRRNGSIADDISTQSSYDNREDESDFPMETSRMRKLKIEDWGSRERDREADFYQPGQKRRASSPLNEDMPLPTDPLRRRESGILSRGSPTPRLTVIPQGSVSSISSPASRSNSYASNLTASSITSIGSFGRRSPNGLSPSGLSPTDGSCGSPYTTPLSAATSPRSALSRAMAMQPPHHRTLSEQTMMAPAGRAMASPRKHTEIPKNASCLVAAKLKGPYMCECCPKKPKKFETEEELKVHEAEKQYECSFCGNRFKNKNEAERHQNSLHVRRHSWSCSALTGYERAFHDSTTKPGEADTCGYCGEEFPRSGRSQNGPLITDQDWEERIRHLQDTHKFRECNSSKKFYRADHFRQHLKHSHAGTSGKWTNMLETACMLEEEPPVPTR